MKKQTLILIRILVYSFQKKIEGALQSEFSLSEELALESSGQIILRTKLKNPYGAPQGKKPMYL